LEIATEVVFFLHCVENIALWCDEKEIIVAALDDELPRDCL